MLNDGAARLLVAKSKVSSTIGVSLKALYVLDCWKGAELVCGGDTMSSAGSIYRGFFVGNPEGVMMREA